MYTHNVYYVCYINSVDKNIRIDEKGGVGHVNFIGHDF